MNKTIVHVSEVEISAKSGMGRVECNWKKAFLKRGFAFIHIGPKEIGPVRHPALFSNKAYNYFRKLNIRPNAFIVHEPVARCFVKRDIPCFIESHGIERRSWEGMLDGTIPTPVRYPLNLRRRILFPIWRLSGCDKGLRHGNKLLLINSEDKEYAKRKYKRKEEDIYVFKNGVNIINQTTPRRSENSFTILFNGSWSERKGIYTLISAAEILHKQGLIPRYLLIGTGQDENSILTEWPEQLRPFVKVIPHFSENDEVEYIRSSSLFVLPSFFEGQPLSLLQAMAAGKCCITTNCCGQRDIIRNDETGILVSCGDPKELAFQIDRCVNNPSLVNDIGKNAKHHVESLSWEKVSQDIVEYVASHS